MPKKPVRSKRPNSAGQSAARRAAAMPAKVPQPHGGALLTGGVPGNKGGGRPPNALRALMRQHLDEVIPEIHTRWKKNEIDDVQYAEYLAKYAIGPLKGVSDAELDAFVKQCAEVVYEVCGPDKFEQVAARLAELRQKQEKA